MDYCVNRDITHFLRNQVIKFKNLKLSSQWKYYNIFFYLYIVSSEDDDYYNSKLVEHALQIPGFPFVPKSNVAQMIAGTNFRRYTRGISEECCYNSCTISELRSYCLP